MPNELSGGMRKRAGFARALVLEPAIVMFDEPDSGLDPVRTALLCELVREVHEENGGCYLVISHDLNTARRDLRLHRRALERQDRRVGAQGGVVRLGEPVRVAVPQRGRHRSALDGLSSIAAWAVRHARLVLAVSVVLAVAAAVAATQLDTDAGTDTLVDSDTRELSGYRTGARSLRRRTGRRGRSGGSAGTDPHSEPRAAACGWRDASRARCQKGRSRSRGPVPNWPKCTQCSSSPGPAPSSTRR